MSVNPRILIVDDEPLILVPLTDRLEDEVPDDEEEYEQTDHNHSERPWECLPVCGVSLQLPHLLVRIVAFPFHKIKISMYKIGGRSVGYQGPP